MTAGRPAPVVVLEGAVLVRAGGAAAATLALAGGRIACAPADGGWRLSLDGHLVLPGLVNAHDHLALNCFPPLPGGPFANSYQWVDAFQPYRNEPEVRARQELPAGVRLWHGGLKNLLQGVTTVMHHDPWDPLFDDPDFPVRVARDCGWCHSPGLAGRYGPRLADSLAATPPARPWFIHLAEGTDPASRLELETLAQAGGLSGRTVLVHGVGLSRDDLARVAAAGAGVVWCPRSNLRLLGRTLDPGPLLPGGRVALGTDARVSGGGDMLAEMETACRIDPRAADGILPLVTSAAARLLGDPAAGGLEPGQRADLVVIRDDGDDPRRQLGRLKRAAIRAVVREGRPLLADPDLGGWMDACGVPAVPARLDGEPKLLAAGAARAGAAALEPGLELR